MHQRQSTTSDTTLSDAPLTPFSNRSLLSDGTHTSEESPDLGAFHSVFRALNQLHAPPPQPPSRPQRASETTQHQARADHASGRPFTPDSFTHEDVDIESDQGYGDDYGAAEADGAGATVWTQHPIARYLRHEHAPRASSPATSASPEAISEEDDDDDGEESETEQDGDGDIDVVALSIPPPALGLDTALGYLAAERAKLDVAAVRVGANGRGAGGEWRHEVVPKRKRRRKRKNRATDVDADDGRQPGATDTAVPARTPELSSSPGGSSSSPRKNASATATGGPSSARIPIPSKPRAPVPSFVTSISAPTSIAVPSPRADRLRRLVHRLKKEFPFNDNTLSALLAARPSALDQLDPRGCPPSPGDPLTHVFIDHSNILIGFLNFVRRYRAKPVPAGRLHLWFAALALILERGRPIARRVLATSSPLYQTMDDAEALGYQVHVYARVPDLEGLVAGSPPVANGTGANGSGAGTGLNSAGKPRRPALQTSGLPESDPGYALSASASGSGGGQRGGTLPARPTAHVPGHSRSSSHPVGALTSSSASSPTPPSGTHHAVSASLSGSAARIRYREQGVDELLQLKLHQALVSPEADPLPRAGATIVLATGDGASGQFNEDGFVGVVRTALKKGWRVELYGWGRAISGMWRRLLVEEEVRGRFAVWEMDSWVEELLMVGEP